jgi:transposase-like protein
LLAALLQASDSAPWNYGDEDATFPTMKKSDVTCPECSAGYRRVELISKPGTRGEFRCLVCGHLLEVFDGSTEVAIRLTVQPEKIFE